MNPFKLSWFHMIPADFLSPMFSLTFQEGWDLTGYKSVYLIIPGILQIAPSLTIYSTNMYQHSSIFLVFHNLYIMVQWQWKLDPSSNNVYIYIYHISFNNKKRRSGVFHGIHGRLQQKTSKNTPAHWSLTNPPKEMIGNSPLWSPFEKPVTWRCFEQKWGGHRRDPKGSYVFVEVTLVFFKRSREAI